MGFRDPKTYIRYWVLIEPEGARIDMIPSEIAALLNDGFKLDIVIHPAQH
jgi:hypothetical protein